VLPTSRPCGTKSTDVFGHADLFLGVPKTHSPEKLFIILKTAVNAGGFAQSFGRLRLALSAPRTARCASGKRKPHPPQNLAQTHPAELPFLGLFLRYWGKIFQT
jgi:hypothetical protein